VARRAPPGPLRLPGLCRRPPPGGPGPGPADLVRSGPPSGQVYYSAEVEETRTMAHWHTATECQSCAHGE
jgi:hypothetical protein